MKAGITIVIAAALVGCGDDATMDTGADGVTTASDAGSSGTRTTSGGEETGGMGSGGGTGTADGTGGTQGSSSGSSAGSGSGSGSGSDSDSDSGTTGGGGLSCNPTMVLCDGPVPACPAGEVPEVVDGCWGDCIPILECATEPDCSNCQDGFCAEYVAFTLEYRCVMPTLMCAALQCNCLAPYFCVDPFDACTESPMDGDVSCGCPSCDR